MSLDGNEEELEFKQIFNLDERTDDVKTNTSFESLMINPTIVESLMRYGYYKPSPVQAFALPLGLLGMDMLVQAKTGTGKTLVFAILCADHLINSFNRDRTPQVMIVSPTREIAMQSCEVTRKISPKEFYHGLFVGGIDMEIDKKILRKGCQVAIGTSGRLAHLVKTKILNPNKIKLFILDEADKLMEDSFKSEINLKSDEVQVCVFSATYPRNLDKILCNYMKDPSLVRLNVEDRELIGIKQYVVYNDKQSDVYTLLKLINSITFNQCLIFTNDQKRCTEVQNFLKDNQINASQFSSALTQKERFKVMKDFKNFRIRILVSSNLSSRGIDVEHVNLIINLEVPKSVESYLHRIGRAGRFGSQGAALTVLATEKELYYFKLLVRRENLNIRSLNLNYDFPHDLPSNTDYFDQKARKFVSMKDNVLSKFDKICKIEENCDENNINQQTLCSNNLNNCSYSYLRKEMLDIRDQASNKEWEIYGQKFLNFNESEIIRLLSKKSDQRQHCKNIIKKESKLKETTVALELIEYVVKEELCFSNVNYFNLCDRLKIEYETLINNSLASNADNNSVQETQEIDAEHVNLINNFEENLLSLKLFKRKTNSDYGAHISYITQMLKEDDENNELLKKINLSLSKE